MKRTQRFTRDYKMKEINYKRESRGKIKMKEVKEKVMEITSEKKHIKIKFG